MKVQVGWFVAAALAAAVCEAHSAEVIRIDDAPFPMPPITVADVPDRTFAITDFGAKGDGTKCTAAFAAAMAACEKAGGGHVVVPAGKWVTGAIRFKSGCDLHLTKDAVLEFTDDPADYPLVHTTWEGVECMNHSPLIFAYGVTNVSITGAGTIAPKMDLWRKWFARPPEHMKATEMLYHWCSTNAPMAARDITAIRGANVRPHLIQFNRARNVLVEGVRIRETPFWTIHLYLSENCVVRKIDSAATGHNSDGLDVDMTRNVLVENCRFNQSDDGICLKAGRNQDAWRLHTPTENVVIRDCYLNTSQSLLAIGSELSGGIRNVWMTRCKIFDTGGFFRIKTNRRRGGFVENVWMDHCTGNRVTWVVSIDTNVLFQWANFPDYELKYTKIRNVNISDVDVNRAEWGVQILADEHCKPQDITIRNVHVGKVARKLREVKNCDAIRIEALTEGDQR